MAEDGAQDKTELSPEESKNRLAAAEFDMRRIAEHISSGNHPGLNET